MTLAGALAVALAVTAIGLAPFARVRIGRSPREHPDAAALSDAGWTHPLWLWESGRAASIAIFAALAIVVGVTLVVALALGAALPSLAARVRADGARSRARRATARILRAAEGAMRSGSALPEALRRACEGVEDPLARGPFAGALRAFDLGAPLDVSLREAATRARDERASAALETLALGVAARLPTERAAQLVAAVADRLAFAERLDEEVRARTAGSRLQVILLAAIVPGLALYLAATVPALATTLGTPLGRGLLVPGAAVLEIAGIVLSRRAVSRAIR